MYIALVVFATLIFAVQFTANAEYSRTEGGALHKGLLLSLLSGASACVMLVFTVDKWQFTVFSFVLALLSALAYVIMMWCSVKVLNKGELAVYSLFSQIGGMLIPSLAGILFYAEPLTWQRAVCIALVIIATLIGKPQKEKKNGGKHAGALVWYLSVFVLNGMWGTFAKMHQSAPEIAVSSSMFSMMTRMLITVIAGIALIPAMRSVTKPVLNKPKKSCILVLVSGVLNTLGNLIMLEALLHVDASIQYPVATGGMMVLTVIVDRLYGRKPTARTLISIAIAFVGLLLLAL